MLTLISTPIGHLEDISPRALKALEQSDAILAEDTRKSSILLNRYGIKNRLISFPQFKERKDLERILNELEAGKRLALISDAGTPCINDPGFILVRGCIERGIPFTAIPGPCSLIQALVLSGMDTARFQFIGFLPRKAEGALRQALSYPGTTVAFESPERLIDTLGLLVKLDPKRLLSVAREMTKAFEECRRGTAGELLEHFEKCKPRGEIVLLIAGGEAPAAEMPIEELIEMLQELHGLTLKEAIKTAARLTKTAKSAVYKKIHLNSSVLNKK